MNAANEQWEKVSNNLWNKVLIIFIVLCSLSFFLIKGIGKGDRVIELVGIGLIIFYLLLYLIYTRPNSQIKSGYSTFVLLMFMGIIISTIACAYFHDQPLSITFYQQRHTYYLLFYFLLPFLYPNPQWIKDLIYYLALTGAVIYILQHFAYPFKITEAKMFVDRGTLRINLPGGAFMHLGYFLCVDLFFRTSKRKYSIGALILLITATISGFRSVLSIYVLLAGVYMLVNKHVKNKILIIFVSIIIVFAGFFAFQDIITQMKTSAERETSQGSDYIRVKAGKYLLAKMGENKMIYLTGNGQPSERSVYGRETSGIGLYYGYYLSDVGIIGSYFKFGLLFVLTALFVMLKITFMKLPTDLQFVRLFMIMQLLVIFLSYFTFEGGEGSILLCLILYLIDRHKSNPNELQNETVVPSSPLTSNIKILNN